MGRKKRSLKPRTRESVENRQLGVDGDSGRMLTPRGDYSLNPNLSGVRLDKPRCYKKGKTVIRIWNMLDPENPEGALMNGRLSALDTAGLGGMSISEPAICVQYAGVTKESGLEVGQSAEPCSYIIARSKSCSYEGIPFWDLPYPKLYTTAKRALDTGKFGDGRSWDPSWNILLRSSMPALGSFKQRYFVVCSVYENGPNLDLTRELVEYRKDNKEFSQEYPRNGIALGDAPNDPLMVLMLPVSAGKKLLQMCNIEKMDYEGDENVDPSVAFKYGDPCGKFDPATQTVNGGLFFTIYNPEKVSIEKHTSYSGHTNTQVVEYECAVSSKYEGPNGTISASLSAEQTDNIFNKHLFLWKDSEEDPNNSYLLHEPSIEERCVMLAKAFKPVPKLLEYCWMSHPEYLEFDSVVSILRNRTTVAKPVALTEDEDDDEDEVVVQTKPKASQKVAVAAKKKTASELVDELDEDEDEEDEDIRTTASSLDDDDDDEDVEDDDVEDTDEEEAEDADDEEYDEEDDEESSEYDSFDDETEADSDSDLEAQLNESLSKAKAVARSKNRKSGRPGKK